jgi:hypothetical protein
MREERGRVCETLSRMELRKTRRRKGETDNSHAHLAAVGCSQGLSLLGLLRSQAGWEGTGEREETRNMNCLPPSMEAYRETKPRTCSLGAILPKKES